ncbi:MAG: phosphopantetheine adenylyltransferase [Pseudomonadota bacterium]
MSSKFVALILLVVGVANLVPVVGVLSGAKLQQLYGMTIDAPNLLILMRHRAVLFGLLGGFILASVFVPGWRMAAIFAALVSMLTFIALAYAQDGFNPAIRKVVMIDLVLSVALIPALVLELRAD